MARPRPLHALSTDLLFHRVGISRRRAAHEPKRLESPEFRPFPLALRLSYRADCQVSSCPFRDRKYAEPATDKMEQLRLCREIRHTTTLTDSITCGYPTDL